MEKEIIKKMAKELEMTVESMTANKDYYTENVGRDGKLYCWYYDGTTQLIYCVEDGRKVDDEEEIEKLFL